MQGRALVKQPTTPEPFSAIHGELSTLVKEQVHSNTHRLTGREDLTMASPDAFQSACGRRVLSWRGKGQLRWCTSRPILGNRVLRPDLAASLENGMVIGVSIEATSFLGILARRLAYSWLLLLNEAEGNLNPSSSVGR